jgi:tRNA nucleotidyltransferase/poly(A) polymerase
MSNNSYKHAIQTLIDLESAGVPAMLAGGCVRDRLLGLGVTDYDIAAAKPPEDILKIAKKLNWKAVPTGIQHGTVTLVIDDYHYEVTSLRRDVSTDGRHANVEYCGVSFAEDAMRRDFTVNALFEDAHGKIHDYVDGQNDLKSKLLRFVGDPEARIKEDYLRILRFFRFWSKLNFAPDERSLKALGANLMGLGKISKERIGKEFLGTLRGAAAATALCEMERLGVLDALFGKTKATLDLIRSLHTVSTSMDEDLRVWLYMTALFLRDAPRSEHVAKEIALSLKLTNGEQSQLNLLLKGWHGLTTIGTKASDEMCFIDQYDSEKFPFMQTSLRIWSAVADVSSDEPARSTLFRLQTREINEHTLRISIMPMTGDDVIALRPDLRGSQIGAALDQLLASFRNREWTTRDEGLGFLANI